MNRITLSGNVRQQVGTKNAAQLRRVKRVPCVLYGGAGTVHFSVDEAALRAFAARFFPLGNGPTMALRTCMFTNSPDEHFIIGLHLSLIHI